MVSCQLASKVRSPADHHPRWPGKDTLVVTHRADVYGESLPGGMSLREAVTHLHLDRTI